jgi:hypothetical protein
MACHQAGPQQASKAGWEVADIFRQFGSEYRESRPRSSAQHKVMRAIEVCRTAILGGHKEVCKHCGAKRHAYNSCRNRHCPKCQTLVKAQWLEDRKAELLPVPYFHGVFTLPHELNALVLANKTVLLNMLFATVSATLLEFGRNNLGGKIGFTMLLHTWNQLLRPHFHVHCVIPAGALSEHGQRWIPGNARFLFAVKALSKVFCGKFVDALEQAYAEGKLCFVGAAEELATPAGFANLIQGLRTADWVVFSKRPFGGPEKVLDYLGRYTHRVAISNHRILDVSDGEVTFSFRDRRHDDELRTATVSANEFIRRFLLHVLPDGFVRIRHFGFLASRTKAKDLPRCREILGQPPELPPRRRLTVAEWVKELLDVDVNRCPSCGRGPLVRITLPPLTPTARRQPSELTPIVMDTS